MSSGKRRREEDVAGELPEVKRRKTEGNEHAQSVADKNKEISQLNQAHAQIKLARDCEQQKDYKLKIQRLKQKMKQETEQFKLETEKIKLETEKIKQETAKIKLETEKTKQETEKIKLETKHLELQNAQLTQQITLEAKKNKQEDNLRQEITEVSKRSPMEELRKDFAELKQQVDAMAAKF